MPGSRNFLNSFTRKVRKNGSKVSLANIRRAEEVQGMINMARTRIAAAKERNAAARTIQQTFRKKRAARRSGSRSGSKRSGSK
jgi:hypothetical protein